MAAEKRMFSKKIISSDKFMDMPATAQILYFHLCMNADDDGFLDNANSLVRMTGAKKSDLKLLSDKNYVILFDSGIVLIAHWKLHNTIQKDRYVETVWIQEKSQVTLDENKIYQTLETERIQNVSIEKQEPRIQSVSKMDPERKQNVSIESDIESDIESVEVGGGNTIGFKAAPELTTADQQEWVKEWNEIPHTQNIDGIIPGTQRYDEMRICEGLYGVDNIRTAFHKVRESPYLKRLGGIRFDNYINRNVLQKLLEGAYDKDYQQEDKHGSFWDD